MTLDTAETVLSTFSFSREAYHFFSMPRSRPKELREEFRKERELKVRTEEMDIW